VQEVVGYLALCRSSVVTTSARAGSGFGAAFRVAFLAAAALRTGAARIRAASTNEPALFSSSNRQRRFGTLSVEPASAQRYECGPFYVNSPGSQLHTSACANVDTSVDGA